MPDRPEIVFLLMSDLHFGADLLAEGEGELLSVPWWLKFRGYGIQQYLNRRCAAHDVGILKALPRYLKLALGDLNLAGYPRSDFDLYLVLGDAATRPTGSTYQFLAKYLTKASYETGDAELKHSCAALNITPNRLVIIPGNHDKLLLTNLVLYQQELLKPLGLPPEPKRQSSFLLHRRIEDREFLFLLIEASKYAAQDNYMDLSCRQHLAAGEIDESQGAAIRTKLEKLKRGETIDGVSLKSYSKTTKILLVHYAVDVLAVTGTSHAEDLILPHECPGLAKLIESLKSEVDLVVHGHLHKSKLYKQSGVPVVSVTTTTQKSSSSNKEQENGFFLLKFFKSGEVRAEHYKWFGTGFLRDDREELNQLLFGPKADSAGVV